MISKYVAREASECAVDGAAVTAGCSRLPASVPAFVSMHSTVRAAQDACVCSCDVRSFVQVESALHDGENVPLTSPVFCTSTCGENAGDLTDLLSAPTVCST